MSWLGFEVSLRKGVPHGREQGAGGMGSREERGRGSREQEGGDDEEVDEAWERAGWALG